MCLVSLTGGETSLPFILAYFSNEFSSNLFIEVSPATIVATSRFKLPLALRFLSSTLWFERERWFETKRGCRDSLLLFGFGFGKT